MKRLLIPIITLLVGVLIGAMVFRGGKGGEAPAVAAGTSAEVWTCSMHPQVRAPKKGLCPICAMDLIPLSQLGTGGSGRVYPMSESAKVLAGIRTTKVTRRFPEAEVRLYGTIAYEETREQTIAARFPGRIERLFVDYDGIAVKEGDHLATIYSPELLSAQTELLTAKRFGNPDALRIARDKLRLWGFPERRIGEIESSGETSDTLTIDAPASGIVTEKKVRAGDYVMTGAPLFRINDPNALWVVFDAYESDKPWLRYGQAVRFTAEALPGREFEGRIAFLSPELDLKTRTFAVRVNIGNHGGILKPGMFVRGVATAKVAGFGRVLDPSLAGKWISPMHPEIVKDAPGTCDICGMELVRAEDLGYAAVASDAEPPLIIPVSAVLHTGKRSVAYVEKPKQKEPTFEGREVLLGPRAGDFYLVEAGLREGEEVVTEGAFAIDSALQIQARPSMMQPGGEEAPLFPRFTVGEGGLPVIDGIVAAYFDLQLAFAHDDFAKVHSSASGLQKALSVAVPGLAAEAEAAFQDLRARFGEALAAIHGSADLKAARVPFETVSIAADELVRRFGTGELPVFVAHCPMAFNNRGADWLQRDRELLNPYFGDAMLKCGEIREQIAGPEAKPVPDGVPAPEAEGKGKNP